LSDERFVVNFPERDFWPATEFNFRLPRHTPGIALTDPAPFVSSFSRDSHGRHATGNPDPDGT
jgi:hypothetical protein